MDTHSDQQEHRMVQIDVYGAAGSLPDPPSGFAAPLALGEGQAVAEVTNRTGDVVEGGEGWGHGVAPGGGMYRIITKASTDAWHFSTSINVYYAVSVGVASFLSVASTQGVSEAVSRSVRLDFMHLLGYELRRIGALAVTE